MTSITLSSPEFYKGGSGGVSAVVGYESHANRVARYSFTAPEGGASALRLAFSGNSKGNGVYPSLGFFVGTDPDSHADAGMGSPCTGTLTLLEDYVSYSGSADLVLLPNTTYYVWLFPITETFGWMHWSRSTGAAIISLSGAATSALTVSDGILGEPQILEVERYADTTHTLTCTFGDRTETVISQTNAEAITWTPPLSLAEQCPNALSAPAVYTLETFSGGVSIGSRSVTRLLTVPESCVPDLGCSWVDTASHRSFYDALVQQVSKLEVTVEAAGIYGSSIRSTAVLVDGKPYSGGVLESAGQVELTVTATDSRGRTAKTTEMLTVESYSFPKVALTAIRVDGDGNLDDMGEFAKLTVTCTGTDLDTGILPMVGVGRLGEEVEMFDLNGTTYTVTLDAPSTESPTFWALYTDAIMAPARAEAQLSIGYATLDVLSGGKGIAFGTTATQEGFHCAMPAYFTGGLQLGTADLADFVVEQKEISIVADGGREAGKWLMTLWNSGFCELRTRVRFPNVNATAAWGAVYTGFLTGSDIPYPVTFREVPACTVTPAYNNSNCWLATCDGTGSTTVTPRYQIVRPTSATVSVYLNYYACGYIA